MYTSMDLVVEKLERQIRKHKTKLGKKIHQDEMIPQNFDIHEDIDEDTDYKLVKTKRFPHKTHGSGGSYSADESAFPQFLRIYQFGDRNRQCGLQT